MTWSGITRDNVTKDVTEAGSSYQFSLKSQRNVVNVIVGKMTLCLLYCVLGFIVFFNATHFSSFMSEATNASYEKEERKTYKLLQRMIGRTLGNMHYEASLRGCDSVGSASVCSGIGPC